MKPIPFDLRKSAVLSLFSISLLLFSGCMENPATSKDQNPQSLPSQDIGVLITQKASDAGQAALKKMSRRGRAFEFKPNLSAFDKDNLRIDLPNGDTVTAFRIRKVLRPDGLFWYGKANSEPNSEVLLTVRKGQLVGLVNINGELTEITPTADGKHLILEVDEVAKANCGGSVRIPEGLDGMGGAAFPRALQKTAALAAPAAIPRVDVLVVYTPAAQNDYGAEGILSRIQASVEMTNQAYLNSGVNVELNLAGTLLTPYTESGTPGTDLGRLQDPDDGYMDEVYGKRDEVKADLVSCFFHKSEAGIVGVGYEGGPQGTGPDFGFNAVSANYAIDGVFAHEIGHNLGCGHEVGAGDGAFPYSHAFVFKDGNATIMNHILGGVHRFSNPALTYNGEIMGNAETANNARAINEVAPYTEQIRDGSQSSGIQAPSNLTRTLSRRTVTLHWTDNSGNEDGFRIERARKTSNGLTYKVVHSVGANVVRVQDVLPGAGLYYYRVRAFNSETQSAYSNTVRIRKN